MTCSEKFQFAAVVATALLFLNIACTAQESSQDHSCTLNAGGGGVRPFGQDGNNFNSGWWTLQAGGGFRVKSSAEPHHGFALYLNGNFMYARLSATSKALATAKNGDSALGTATSARGGFSAVTFDPTVRYRINRKLGLYASGGFGWFRRGVSFNNASQGTLLNSSASTLDRLASNSGAFDIGGGVNYSLTRHGLMLYAEVRSYYGAAINSTTRLLPFSGGLRW